MTNKDARSWIVDQFGVSRETRLAEFVAILSEESERQNLIAASTLPDIWSRHIADSAQLLRWVPDDFDGGDGLWLDIGSGAGLPGIVIAILRDAPIALVEPRRMRADFLTATAERLGLANVSVHTSKVERYRGNASIISARAVAALPKLLVSAAHCADRNTLWLLPKGRSAQSEVEAARKAWQGVFHVEQSLTDPESHIVIAREVAPR